MLQLEYWISELALKTGVSVRTIRYYIEEGLLPQPEIRGKYAVFNDEYLNRLELIKLLKDAYLPLKEIKTLLDSMNEQQIVRYLHEFKNNPSNARSSLDMVHDHPSGKKELKENAEDYITRILQDSNRTPFNRVQNAPSNRTSAPRSTIIPPPAQPEREDWQRIEIAPGIEFHVRLPISSNRRRQVNRLIELIQNFVLKEGGFK